MVEKISGKAGLRLINSKTNELEETREALNKRVYDFENDISKLTENRESAYTMLAVTYLPTLTAEAVSSTIKEIHEEMNNIFKEKQHKRSTIEKRMVVLKKRKDDLEEIVDNLTNQLNEKSSEHDNLRGLFNASLGQNKQYNHLRSQADQLDKRITSQMVGASEIENNNKAKLEKYNNNKIFMYLLKKKFGTEEYGSTGLSRYIDFKISKLINFNKLSQNYGFLRGLSGRIEGEIGKKKKVLESVVIQMKDIEKGISDEVGLTVITEEGNGLEQERKKYLQEESEVDREYSDQAKLRETIDSTKDPYHQEAVSRLKAYLKGSDIMDLKKRAIETHSEEDDHLVEKLEAIDHSILALKNEAKEAKGQRDKTEYTLEGLKKLKREFRSYDFESDRSYFNRVNFDALLVGYIIGSYNYNDVWSRIKSNQHFKPREESYSSRSSSRSSSGFGGGGFSSGGGFGGGGFSSGRGF